MNNNDWLLQRRSVPPELTGPLRESSLTEWSGAELQGRLEQDGYLFLRGAIDAADVLAARGEVFERLAEVGEIRQPAIDGFATGTSKRRDVGDLGKFWQSVSEGPRLRQVSHGQQACATMTTILDTPARPHDYIFLRPGVVGRSTLLHYDFPFFARGSKRIFTVWTALGDIPTSEGPLVVVEGSHHFHDLIDPVMKIDYESKQSPRVQLDGDPIDFVRSRQTRLLSADFHAGDLVVFSMTTLHGTLDNQSKTGRTRLSCDVRWQPANEPADPRYVGPNPPGTTGAGYAELNGAKPLTEDWHIR